MKRTFLCSLLYRCVYICYSAHLEEKHFCPLQTRHFVRVHPQRFNLLPENTTYLVARWCFGLHLHLVFFIHYQVKITESYYLNNFNIWFSTISNLDLCLNKTRKIVHFYTPTFYDNKCSRTNPVDFAEILNSFRDQWKCSLLM